MPRRETKYVYRMRAAVECWRARADGTWFLLSGGLRRCFAREAEDTGTLVTINFKVCRVFHRGHGMIKYAQEAARVIQIAERLLEDVRCETCNALIERRTLRRHMKSNSHLANAAHKAQRDQGFRFAPYQLTLALKKLGVELRVVKDAWHPGRGGRFGRAGYWSESCYAPKEYVDRYHQMLLAKAAEEKRVALEWEVRIEHVLRATREGDTRALEEAWRHVEACVTEGQMLEAESGL